MLEITLDDFGFSFDTEWVYVSINWKMIILSVVVTALVIATKKWRKRK